MSRRPSSRYSEMPMRVTDHRMSLVNATPQNKDNVFGKLNIPKPQSTTSERRTSFFGKGIGPGGQRNSMFGSYGGPEKMKDPRPLHDKAFVQQCIKQLCEFLVEQGFPGSITVKSLQSPSTKEFLKIYEFIYTLLEPSFQMPTAKVEEEIPRMLKDLGYPFALSKSSMYSIGAPHTWPQALGALIWLIDTVKLFSGLREQGLLFSDFLEEQGDLEEGAEYNKLLMEYCSDTYNKFMQGADTFDDEDDDYLNKLKKLYNVDEALLQSQQDKHAMLMEHVERLERESQTDRLVGKRTEKLRLQADLQKLQNYRCTLEAHKTGLENKAAGLAEELEAAEMQLEGLKQERTRLQHILENQKFTPADIERINRERNELQQTVQILNQSLEEAEQLVWNEEVNLSKTKEKAELKVAEFNKLGRKLKLIPQSAENACGHDFEIRTDYSATSITQYKTQIQNPLKNMMVDVEDECSRLTNVKLSLEETVEQVKSNIFDKENDIKHLKEQIRRVDQQLEHDMQEMAQEEDKWAAEVDSAETHKKRLEKNVTQGCEEAEEELKAAQQQYHVVVQETNEENRMVSKNLTDVLNSAANHLCAVEKHCNEQLKRFGKLKEVIREDDADMKQLMDLVENFVKKVNSV
ncbi:kinetochore protein NDC80 homolog [Puntigrus tetrazona]|uniref:kinetochore protein NDC80 homolog n=1 Tax=Puntigrus tetrazona TaxID=1606681 RepID=UPI001C88E3DF|nr:kinetochore protein NDC80 homolog [Puntigrus tetrazona]